MDKNFVVGQSNELVVGHEIFDLHNIFQLKTLKYDGAKLLIEFEDDTSQKVVTLTFHKVEYFQLSEDFNSNRFWAVEELGYKSDGDYDDNWLLSEKQSSPEDHLFIRLVGNGFLRVHSLRADISCTSK